MKTVLLTLLIVATAILLPKSQAQTATESETPTTPLISPLNQNPAAVIDTFSCSHQLYDAEGKPLVDANVPVIVVRSKDRPGGQDYFFVDGEGSTGTSTVYLKQANAYLVTYITFGFGIKYDMLGVHKRVVQRMCVRHASCFSAPNGGFTCNQPKCPTFSEDPFQPDGGWIDTEFDMKGKPIITNTDSFKYHSESFPGVGVIKTSCRFTGTRVQ